MKIEYLGIRAPEGPLVRLFDFTRSEVEALCAACLALAEGRLREFALHDQQWVQSVAECRFYWRAATKDAGVKQPMTGQPLVLEYTDEGWREVEDKLSQFVDAQRGHFNWLTMEGEVRVLMSVDGTW